ncbi:MAG: hypothetical protein WC205_14920 [Opitutaceae bacterium]
MNPPDLTKKRPWRFLRVLFGLVALAFFTSLMVRSCHGPIDGPPRIDVVPHHPETGPSDIPSAQPRP